MKSNFRERCIIRNNFIGAIFATGTIAALIWGGAVVVSKVSNSRLVLRMALASHWRTLHPGVQHTLAGDLVLSNQFDALVGMDSRGNIVPLGAKSWEINDDFTVFEFKIDTSKRYSDGTYLNASDYKDAWESSAALDAKSANNSLLDVLYKIEGFSDFEKSRRISGIEVVNEMTLRVTFTSPFRMALDHLVGNRFAAHKPSDHDSYVGTGKFIIREETPDKIMLIPNDFNEDPPKNSVTIEYLEAEKIFDGIKDGSIDAIPYLSGHLLDDSTLANQNVQIIPGQDAVHITIGLNRQPGRFFENKCFRQTFQKIILEAFKDKFAPAKALLFSLDPQIYLEGQSGRLEKEEVDGILRGNEICTERFYAANGNDKLKMVTSNSNADIFNFIKNSQLIFTDDTAVLDQKSYLEILYKSADADVVISSFSIANGDPDGIYHRLGQNGAILSPMIYSHSVGSLLEEGRKIVDISKTDAHYKNVAREALRDIPFIHLGFSKAVAILRKDRVQFNDLTLRRNEGHLEVFELK